MADRRGHQAWDAPGSADSTPLDPDDAEGLIPKYVTTRGHLDVAEQDNILAGLTRARWRRTTTTDLLDDLAVRELHRDMFGDVWRWAGTYRKREVTIGVDPIHISTQVRDLIENAKCWLEGDRPMPPDEAGYTFHHRLVKIHPFPNGNGRHARAITDLLLRASGQEPFTWGSASLDVPGTTRSTYIAALRAADGSDYRLLADFVRS